MKMRGGILTDFSPVLIIASKSAASWVSITLVAFESFGCRWKPDWAG